jgi:hypothetical protein
LSTGGVLFPGDTFPGCKWPCSKHSCYELDKHEVVTGDV